MNESIEKALKFFETFDTDLDRNFCAFLRKPDEERNLTFNKIKIEFDKENSENPYWSSVDSLVTKILDDALKGELSSGGHYVMRRLGDI